MDWFDSRCLREGGIDSIIRFLNGARLCSVYRNVPKNVPSYHVIQIRIDLFLIYNYAGHLMSFPFHYDRSRSTKVIQGHWISVISYEADMILGWKGVGFWWVGFRNFDDFLFGSLTDPFSFVEIKLIPLNVPRLWIYANFEVSKSVRIK